jgi:hypothetical protein
MREMTLTCERALDLLRSMGVDDVEELLLKAERIAGERGSDRLGFRHLVLAQGIPWGATGRTGTGDQANHGGGA